MRVSKRTTIIVLALTALFFAFTLLHASWLADAPTGKPKLVADRGVALITDAQGCLVRANSGFGSRQVSSGIESLQLAAGLGADAVVVPTAWEDIDLIVASGAETQCAKDRIQSYDGPIEAAQTLSRPDLIWPADRRMSADRILELLTNRVPDAVARSIFLLPESDRATFAKANPNVRSFSIASARKCAADYRGSLLGSVPKSCVNGVMLLTLDELGFTLWGWPNRFLERMAKTKTTVIIAQDVTDGKIKGLTDVRQYGEIAQGFDGYIWVDKIDELGPALRR